MASYYAANKEKVIARGAAYRAENSDKIRERKAAEYAANKEAHKERGAAYYAKNKEAIREKSRAYYLSHKEAYARQDAARWVAKKDQRREYIVRWHAANPEYRSIRNAARRSAARNASGSHTAADIRAQNTKQGGLCFWCGRPAERDGRKRHVDHVYPLSRGGSNGPENLVIACEHCNTSKNSKMPHEWRKALPAAGCTCNTSCD